MFSPEHALAQRPPFTTRPQLAGSFGMVASTHWLASAAGMSVLEQGGNAFDAAVAAGLVLSVVEPHMNGPGGEVPVIAYHAGRDETFVVAGQGPAPAAATPEAFAAAGLSLIPGSGLLPACVPGAFGAWMLLAREGELGLRDVMRYAVGYARDGYPLPPGASADIAAMEQVFRAEWPASAETYLGGGVPVPGARFANPVLADTFERILAEAEAAGPDKDTQREAARRAFYEGFVAEEMGAYLSHAEVADGTGERHRGLLTAADLAAWRAGTEPATTLDYHGLTVCKTGAWGQGPVFLQQLALLAGFDLDSIAPAAEGASSGRSHDSPDCVRYSPEFIHLVVECAKLAFADREAWYGDPLFTDVPLAELLSPAYATQRRALVTDSASAELRPGRPGGAQPRLADFGLAARAMGAAGSAWHGEPTLAHSGEPADGKPANGQGAHGAAHRRDTCHLDVADRFGNVVTATPSGGWLHSSPVIPGLGFCLGTRAQMFSLTPGLPNSLRPGKRPRTTLSPTLVLRDGAPYLAFGTPGGDQQDQWPLVFFLNHVHGGMNLQQAIDAPSFHTRHFPSSFYPRDSSPGTLDVESRVGNEVIAALRERGHEVTVMPPWSLGRVSAVARWGDFLYAAANPRGMQGYAAGR